MNYNNFEFLLNKIPPMIANQDTDLREPTPVKYRLAITIRLFASGETYHSLHYLFRVSVPSISKVVLMFAKR